MVLVEFDRREVRVSVPVPRGLRTAVRRLRGRPEVAPAGGLIFGDTPTLDIEQRDPVEAVRFFNARQENPGAKGHAYEAGAPAAPAVNLPPEVAALSWYHTMELPGGVVTPGIFDHRELVKHYGFPADMTGMTALDVATFDGYWAFEMERRGATVSAIDIAWLSQTDLPPAVKEELLRSDSDQRLGQGFALARELLESKVERIECNVYDLSPEKVGTYDFVHMADLLLHLKDPLSALRAVRSITTGRAHLVDCYMAEKPFSDRRLIQYYGGWYSATWWLPQLDALAQMVIDAGFRDVRVHRTYNLAAADEPSGFWRAILVAEV